MALNCGDALAKIPVQNSKNDSGRSWVCLEPNTPFRLPYSNGKNERLKRVDKHFQRLQEHENQLAKNLVEVRNPKRPKRIWPCDLRRK
jgi:transposase InsO family protein